MGNADYKISNQPGYILVERTQGYEVVLDDQPAMLADISAACKEAGYRKVLLLGPETKVKLSIMDIFELGQEIANVGLKIAVVESHDALTESVDFLENVTFNRGGAIEFFDDERDAKNWLGIA